MTRLVLPDAVDPDSPAPSGRVAETVGVVALCALAALVAVALPLAWTGHYVAELLFPAWIAVTLVLVLVARPTSWRPRIGRPDASAVLTVVVIVLSTALNLSASAAHIATDRDPGVYTVAARWLARSGETSAPGIAGTPFATVPGVRGDTALGYADPDHRGERIELQPSAGMPSIVAVAELIGGDRLLFRAAPLLALLSLAFFAALARQITGRWFGLVAVAALAASFPQAYIARDTFAETATEALTMGGLWLLLVALRDGRVPRAVVAGIALGAAAAVHFPALAVVAALILAATLETWLGGDDRAGAERARCYLAACVPALGVAIVGVLGLRHWNGPYFAALREFIVDFTALIGVVLLAYAAALLARRAGRLPRDGGRLRPVIGVLAGAIVALAAGYGVALRPSLERGRVAAAAVDGVAALQRAAGVAVDPNRSYAEQSLRWLLDYLGPVALLLGFAGIGLACVYATRRDQLAPRLCVPLAVIPTAVFAIQPAAYPDQPWVMRRYAPESIPLLLLFATWFLCWLWRRDVGRRLLRPAVVVAAVLTVALPLAVLRPIARAETGRDAEDAIHRLCRDIGPDAAVLVVQDRAAGAWYPQTVRAFCNVPSATMPTPTAAAVRSLADGWAARGRRLYVLGLGPGDLASSGVPPSAVRVISVSSNSAPELTINRPPSHYRRSTTQFAFAPAAS